MKDTPPTNDTNGLGSSLEALRAPHVMASDTTMRDGRCAGSESARVATPLAPRQREWPVSDRARWLPALAMAIGIIYGGDTRDGRSSGEPGSGTPRS
jgi:hypothetical protein